MSKNSVFTGLLAALFLTGCTDTPKPASDTMADALYGFENPQDSARTKVWWFHGETETTREGITADLEAYKKAGVGGVVYYDQVHGTSENALPGFSPEWWEMLRFSAEDAPPVLATVAVNCCVLPFCTLAEIGVIVTLVTAGTEKPETVMFIVAVRAAASAAEGATSGQQMQDAFNGNFEKIAGNFTELNASVESAVQDISAIESLIPDTASPTNKLADRDFVNSSITATAARPLTYDAAGNPFPTKASLTGATTFYNKGVAVTPTENDYVVVQANETQAGGQVRYGYDGTAWAGKPRPYDRGF